MTLLQKNRNARVKTNKMSHLNILIFSLILCWFISISAKAETTQNLTALSNTSQLAQLKVTPKPCVALRKGQKCYLEVTFQWQHPTMSDYCLINTTTSKTMKCWKQQTKGQFSFDFQSKLSNDFALRKQASTIDIVKATIPVAWVYKSSKRAKSTWRLF